jgi:RHS repeat-associated protein
MMTRRFTSLGTAAVLTATLLTARPTGAQSASPLAIQPSGTNQVQLFWPVTAQFNVLQEILGVEGTNLWQDVPGVPAVLGTRYSLRLDATNSVAFYRLANTWAAAASTLPDPASVAPAPQPNVFNDLASLTAFLYTGSNAVQVGVSPGTIKSAQAAVLRGRVLQRDNSPLPGVRVALLGHPEFGYTYSRTNGMYDLALNAATYTVDYQAIGYCPAQRQVAVPALGYGAAPDVVLVPQDVVATPVQFGSNAPAQVAMSSPRTDAAGTRSATVFIPAGTAATMLMPDGSSQPVTNLTIRLTEFTVGTNGPAAMPAALPPNSGYTYCAEFSSDEALIAGATATQFSQPVPVYVDNFLGVAVGTLVPVGYYDRVQGVWVPSSNGIVMAVLGSTNGIALIDLHGTGQPETPDTLAANGFTAEELQTLAALYPVAGKTLWRSPVTRDEPIDFNFGKGTANVHGNTQGAKPKPDNHDNSPNEFGTLNFSAQTFTEQIPLVGMPFTLNYNSARVPDYRVDDQITIPVAWQPPPNPCTNLPSGVVCAVSTNYFNPPIGIMVETVGAGDQSVQSYPGTNQVVTVSWDGRDGYGRLVGGTCLANIAIAYLFSPWDYFGVCCGPEFQAQFPVLFGNDANSVSFEGHVGYTQAVGATFQRLLTYPDHRKLGLGGWSPTPLHRLDPTGGILYYGDGRIRNVPQQSGQDSFLNSLQYIGSMAAAMPDGTVYFYGKIGNEWYIFRRNPGGGYELVTASLETPGAVAAMNGWSQIDGMPTDLVSMDEAQFYSMSAGPDGSLYVTDGSVIVRMTPDGIWHVILGLDASIPPVLQPDGTPAAQSFASAGGFTLLAVGPDDSVYFSSIWPYDAPGANGTNYTMVRKVATDGRIYTVFGAGGLSLTVEPYPTWKALFGMSAYGAQYSTVNGMSGLAVGNDGTVYVSMYDGISTGIFKISTGGVILPLLNGAPGCAEGLIDPDPADTNVTAQIQGDQGKLATDVSNHWSVPACLQVAQDGSVYFTDGGLFVWRVNPNGIVERVAGRYNVSVSPPADLPLDYGDPLNTYLNLPVAMALTPDDSLFLIDIFFENFGMTPIYIIPGRSSLHGTLAPISIQNIPSEDASEVYVFDSTGRHLQTQDSLTGATKWAFGYDTNSLVVSITDLAGIVTQIERDASGQATALVGPYGQRTSLAMDANGFLSAVTNPANETTSLTNSSGGLLLSITGPLGETYSVAYDSLGRATQVADPLGGGWTDSYSDLGVLSDSSYEVDVNCTNSLGDTQTRRMLLEPNGDTCVNYSLDGYPTETEVLQLSGDASISYGDGSALYTGVGADPRFGNQAEQVVLHTLSLPNGLVYKATIQRSVGLANQADPFSLTGLTNVTTINGNSYTEVYNPTNRTHTFTSPEARTVLTVDDALGRPITISAPNLLNENVTYDAFGRLAGITNVSSMGAATTAFAYDGLGQLSTITGPLGRTNAFSYDTAGRLRLLTLSEGSSVGFVQDSEGHLTSVTPPGRPAHTFAYNPVGLIVKYTPPLVSADESVGFQYDTERNLTQVTFPDGQIVTLQRGLAGRVEEETRGAGPTLRYYYGTNTGSGYLMPVAITSTTGDALQFEYAGSMLTNSAWSGSVTGQVAVQLNSALMPVSDSVDGSMVTYTYDRDLLLTQAGPLNLARDPSSGLLTGSSLGVVTDQRQFDDRGLLTNYVASVNATSIWSFNLSYDLAGRITNRVETIGGVTASVSYVYDVAGRLQQVWGDGALSVTYTYDANGNRLSRNSETASYDAQDRVQTYAGTTFSWSPNGNLRTRASGGQTTTYNDDVMGCLTAVGLPQGGEIEYLNDPYGRRIGKMAGGILQAGWLWHGAQPIAQLDGNSSVVFRFIYAGGNAPACGIQGTNTYRILTDERGSVRLVVNMADGSIAQRLDYDEFGRVLNDTSPGFQPFGYAGGLYDPDTSLVRFSARDYSAETGQWTARDPLYFDGGQLSLYAYVGNDPLNSNDPLGLGPNSNGNGPAPDVPPGPKRVTVSAGRVGVASTYNYVNQGGQFSPVQVGDIYGPGDLLHLGPDSHVSLLLDNGNIIRLNGGTQGLDINIEGPPGWSGPRGRQAPMSPYEQRGPNAAVANYG